MWFFKKSIDEEKFVSLFIYQCYSISEEINEVVSSLGFSGKRKKLQLDADIFSVWVVSLALETKKQKDLLHNLFVSVKYPYLDEQDKFYSRIQDTYADYHFGYNSWVKNHQNGAQLGLIISKIIFEQKSNLNAENEIILGDFSVGMQFFSVFANGLKSTLSLKNDILKKYKIN